MKTEKIEFLNPEGQKLYGKISLPVNQKAHNYVIFAHCFTCNKNLLAIKNISNALTSKGFGVLSFDFTGLGESEGEFADTNFSGNVKDISSAAKFLAENYKAPSLLIGHSLGGAAVLHASKDIESVQAVATIGAPSEPVHVKKLLSENIEEINRKGFATVQLSGRPFTIKKQFLEDLNNQSLLELVAKLKKSLLILHSPQDKIVEIKNAEEIYKAAFHPKSFISLNKADHLLSHKEDSVYAGQVISSWASRYVEIPTPVKLSTSHEVVASLNQEDGLLTQMKVGNHYMIADEPESLGGNDFGPSPFELVTAGLSACTVMTLQMYARRKKWNLKNAYVHTNHDKIKNEAGVVEDVFTRAIELEGDLDEKQRKRLIEIANKCPVHKTLHQQAKIITEEKKIK